MSKGVDENKKLPAMTTAVKISHTVASRKAERIEAHRPRAPRFKTGDFSLFSLTHPIEPVASGVPAARLVQPNTVGQETRSSGATWFNDKKDTTP